MSFALTPPTGLELPELAPRLTLRRPFLRQKEREGNQLWRKMFTGADRYCLHSEQIPESDWLCTATFTSAAIEVAAVVDFGSSRSSYG
jgi:hypothetical protein